MKPKKQSPRNVRSVLPASPAIAREGWWTRTKRYLKNLSTVVKAIFATVAAITGWYVLTLLKIDADRDRRRAAIASATSSLRGAATPEKNKATLDSLSIVGLAEHLEPMVIHGLVGFIGDKTRVHGCESPLTPAEAASLARQNIDQALQLIQRLQTTGHTRHSYPDRVIDATLAMWHGEQVAVADGTIRLDGADLRGANLRRMDLQGASFVGACLLGAHLDSAQLTGASFQQAKLDRDTLDLAILDRTSFVRASLRFASLQKARGRATNFERTDLTGADLTGVRLDSANFHAAVLSCATLGNATIARSYLSGATANWTYFGGDSLLDLERWREVRGFRGAYLAETYGLSEDMRKFADDSGAVPDTIDQLTWTERKEAQFKPRGLCAPAQR